MARTSAIGKELDEPGVEANAIGGAEPDVLIGESETRGIDGVGLGETWKHRNIDELLLKRHQQCHPCYHQPSHAVQQDVHIRNHFLSLTLTLIFALPQFLIRTGITEEQEKLK
ncbi:hypothetical protein V8G54_016991 [Vigna mungo]|uniref:Uncharacterized protein n=1 Tax=Vigna mungo TaxID=3915 RepID=A0AAQ3NM72_VIGMU